MTGIHCIINQVPTYYANNSQDLNLVLDLIFIHINTKEFDNHFILSDFQGLSNHHASLSVYIIIEEEFI